MWGSQSNPSVRWVQFSLLALLTGFVGAMWGLERAMVPLIAQQDFGISSATVALSFVGAFGATKAFANLFAGGLMDRAGRRRVLVLGWIVGLPVPLMIIWAPSWGWIVGANLLLGINQGLCWTATLLMMMDILGAGRRGLSTGLNEFVGYGGVAALTFATGLIATSFAPRPQPFIIGIVLASLGVLLSALLVRETGHLPREEARGRSSQESTPSFIGALAASVRDRNLMSCAQAGLVTKINDATVWGLLPLFLTARGTSIGTIGTVAAIYPMVFAGSQLITGTLSDHLGRKPLIVVGMLMQALGMWLLGAGEGLRVWVAGMGVLGIGTAAVYPTLIAFVGDAAHPFRQASAIGIYRWYRDGGFIVGALVAGTLADTFGYRQAFLAIGTLSALSGVVAMARMIEPSRRAKGTWLRRFL